MSSTKFVLSIRNTRWPPRLLIGWDISDYSSETTKRNSTKIDRNRELNVLYHVCVFRAGRRIKIAAQAFDRLRYCRLLLWNCWIHFNETWQEARSQRLYKVYVFRVNRKTEMPAPTSDWHFRLLLWNCSTKFKEYWQEARSQRPLPSFRGFFLGGGALGKHCVSHAHRKNQILPPSPIRKRRWRIVLRYTIWGPLCHLLNGACDQAIILVVVLKDFAQIRLSMN